MAASRRRQSGPSGKRAAREPGIAPSAQRFAPQVCASRVLERPRLTEAFLAAPPGSVVILEAPAGYGKTHALAQWHAAALADKRTVIWLSLRSSDRNGMALANMLAAAMTRAGLKPPRTTSHVSYRPGESPWQHIVEGLTDAVRQFGRPTVLFIDDYEQAEGTEADALMRALFDELPGNLLISVASRHRLPFSVSRWLLQGRVHRLDRHTLPFSKAETRELFEGALSPAALQRLDALAAGWPAAVRIAQLCFPAWRGQPGALDASPAFARLICEFCTEEVLSNVGEECSELLLRASVFETMEPRLCDVIREREDSAIRLAELGARETFMELVDSSANTWRVPELVRYALMRLLAERGPGETAATHRRAAKLYERDGATLEAVRHYVAAGAGEQAAIALERVSPICLAGTQGDMYADTILSLIPAQYLSQFPRLVLCRVYLDYKKGFLEEAQYLLEKVAGWTNEFSVDRASGNALQLEAEALMVKVLMDLYRGVPASAAYLSEAESRVSRICKANPRLGGPAHTQLLILYAIRGDLEAARAHMIKAEKLAAEEPSPWTSLWLHYHRGSLGLAHGQMAEARYHLQAGLKCWRREFAYYKAFGAAANVLMAEIDYENDALSEAQARLDEAINIAENTEGWFDNYSVLYEVGIMVRLHSRGGEEAEAFLAHASSSRRVSTVLEGFLQVLKLRIHTLLGQWASIEAEMHVAALAERWARPTHQDEFGWRTWDLAGVCLCHEAVHRGDLSAAVDILDSLEKEARSHRRTRTLVKALALRSAVSLLQNQPALAKSKMVQALELGGPQAYLRTYLDEGVLIRPTLELVADADPMDVPQRTASLASKLLAGLASRSGAATTHSAGLLSKREREVIFELSLGHSNKLIARRLSLSEPTVKFHLNNIFRKLDVRKRASAVVEAQRRGLLS